MASTRVGGFGLLGALVLAAALFAMDTQAADLAKKQAETAPAPTAPATPLWDFAFGGKLMSDYISRGITQTDHSPGVTAYGELRFNPNDANQFYAGTQIWTVRLPTNPAAEVDLYGGWRGTFGKFVLDLGGIYYLYPDNTRQFFIDQNGLAHVRPPAFVCGAPPCVPTTAKDPSYFEIYAKPTFAVTDEFTFGANVYYAPNWTNVRASETYLSGTVKYTFGQTGFSVSGEFGHEFLGTSSAAFGPTRYKSYNTWNAGVSYAWKQFTLDLRYYGTDLNKSACFVNTSDPRGSIPGTLATQRSGWCDQRFVATLSFDLQVSKDLK
jgi:hypothetical protein